MDALHSDKCWMKTKLLLDPDTGKKLESTYAELVIYDAEEAPITADSDPWVMVVFGPLENDDERDARVHAFELKDFEIFKKQILQFREQGCSDPVKHDLGLFMGISWITEDLENEYCIYNRFSQYGIRELSLRMRRKSLSRFRRSIEKAFEAYRLIQKQRFGRTATPVPTLPVQEKKAEEQQSSDQQDETSAPTTITKEENHEADLSKDDQTQDDALPGAGSDEGSRSSVPS